eukprot:CAMPEP_0202379546 /NCGR_PEP_ID=MMETSP1127-20130417/24596_1 /ASSEMBLY_ACC=CAM_ASM_000462 /TAXON_ID=3047 /ORGANISM="Dunaliella tertiolecta, Strain CCMP1320" /LENGTH=66 /DNA_ID=CAMNT_0048978079 /DNA_START=278 /DNA_END=475 /DNA_ORIENTATION=+
MKGLTMIDTLRGCGMDMSKKTNERWRSCMTGFQAANTVSPSWHVSQMCLGSSAPTWFRSTSVLSTN